MNPDRFTVGPKSASRSRRLILRLARARCARHSRSTDGFCDACFRTELESHVARATPALERDEIVAFVDRWMQSEALPRA